MYELKFYRNLFPEDAPLLVRQEVKTFGISGIQN